jgi:hypothetical protein
MDAKLAESDVIGSWCCETARASVEIGNASQGLFALSLKTSDRIAEGAR